MFKNNKKYWVGILGLPIVLVVIFFVFKDFFIQKREVETKIESFQARKEIEEKKPENELRFGWVSDIHLGDNNHEDKMPTLGDEAIEKIIPEMIDREAEFVVSTGDMIDNFHKNHDEVIGFHKKVKELFNKYPLETYYVLGNHDVQTTTKKEVIDIYEIPSNYYVFQKRGITFIVVDQQFNPDGSSYDDGEHYIPGSFPLSQLKWIEKELSKAPGKVVILAHQPIYSVESEDGPGGEIYPYNGELFQQILEKSGKVLAVLSGHRQPAPEERQREFKGVKHFILPSAIDKKTRLSWGIIKINLETEEIQFDYYADENNDKLKIRYDELSEKCRGDDERNDYLALTKLKKDNLSEFQKIEKLFEKYKGTNFKELKRLSNTNKEKLRDFEDYDCHKRYLEVRQEFAGY